LGRCILGVERRQREKELQMVRIAKETDPKRLEELKNMINNSDYLNQAVQRIAVKLTNEIVHLNEEKYEFK
jgi:hypothetical protein